MTQKPADKSHPYLIFATLSYCKECVIHPPFSVLTPRLPPHPPSTEKVATAVGAGLDNLGYLCSQAGLDRWELLGLAVLSAITVYRKELSSNSVYNGKGAGDGGGGGGRRYHQTDGGGDAVVVHVDGCHVAVAAAAAASAAAAAAAGGIERGSGGHAATAAAAAATAAAAAAAGKPCMCARIAALQRQRASAARRLRATEDERKLQRFVSGRIQSMNLPVNHLQQLRASMDASWSSFSTAWEARRARGSGSGSAAAIDDDAAESERERAKTVPLPVFKMPPCSHHPSGRGLPSEDGEVQQQQHKRGEPRQSTGGEHEEGAPPGGEAGAGAGAAAGAEECVECAAIAAAHLAAASLLRGSIGDGTDGALGDGGDGLLLPGEGDSDDLWAGSSLGVLPADALHRAVAFLAPEDLLELAQVSHGAREAADSQLVWREVWWARFGAVWESEICRKAARRWHLHGWDPKSSAVTQVGLLAAWWRER